ncbi:MAG: tripartite tricarboxylate transporter permease, partial [Candidatus Methanomethylophilaceae archaeon]|nr:tripartite tricarboxylate transporter permease [Candidatus Methanomethylophilaceae archaeon]
MALLGAAMGTFSGLVPGIHVNTLASVMLAVYPSLASAMAFLGDDGSRIAVSCCIMSASVVHSFVDFVPSVFIGAPDAEDAVSVLPAHRLLHQGEG